MLTDGEKGVVKNQGSGLGYKIARLYKPGNNLDLLWSQSYLQPLTW